MAYSMEIDQSTALELVKAGGTLLLLDVPQFTLFGIDTQMFSVGPNFKGIKMVPPGPHYVYYCSSDKDGHEFSPISSFFLTIHPSEIVVRKWFQQEEQLIDVPEDEILRYSEMVKRMELDHHLGPYPLEHFGSWKHLSSYISESTISRIELIGAEVAVENESTSFDQEENAKMEKRMMHLVDSRLSNCSSERTRKQQCHYTNIPKFVMPRNITGEKLTALNLDKSKLLENIIASKFRGEEDLLLGELQFSFIAFMMGQSLEAFMQWKDLVSLFFSCTEAPLCTRSQLFTKFIRVIYFHIKHGFHKDLKKGNIVGMGVSAFLDGDWFSKDVFLFHLCKDFFPLVLNSEVIDGDLLTWTRKLKKLLETTLGWDFADVYTDATWHEDDEYAPVVVSLSEATPNSQEGQAS